MVKPRNHRPITATPSRDCKAPADDSDWSWVWLFIQLAVAAFMLAFIVELIATIWPFLLIGLVIFIFIVACR